MNVAQTLQEAAQRWPHQRAIIYKDTSLTFSELELAANRLANNMIRKGLQQGERVIMLLPDCPQWVISYFAAQKAGAVAVPLDIRLKPEEVKDILGDAQPQFVITTEDLWPAQAPAITGFNYITPVVTGSFAPLGAFSFETMSNEGSEKAPAWAFDEEAVSTLLYTSGTTGRPKGVVTAYRAWDYFPLAMEKMAGCRQGQVGMHVIPMSHICGPILCNLSVKYGITMVILGQFHPVELLKAVHAHKVNWYNAVPPFAEALLKVPENLPFNTSSVEYVSLMGTNIPPELMRRFEERFKTKVIQGYGLTETSPNLTLVPLEHHEKARESIGLACPNVEVAIMGDDGKLLPPGEVGEIVTRGPHVMRGYFNNPQATREVIQKGWFHTGDLGRQDQEGWFYIVGRKKDIIIVGGLNVYAAEVENILATHPKVAEAAVVGVPDPELGEAVKAVVVLHKGESMEAVEVMAHCRQLLASYKKPKLVEFREELPKTPSGKVQKELLKSSN